MNRNLRIGIFTAIGVVLIVGFSVYVNDHPYWYRPCNKVNIHVDDATGLRRKSPVKTLGLDIGYINEVALDGERVMVAVCVTGPVKLNADTRAYIRSSGFLGDKFLELKPVDRLDGEAPSQNTGHTPTATDSSLSAEDRLHQSSSSLKKDHSRQPSSIQLEKTEEPEPTLPEEARPARAILGRILSFASSLLVSEARAADSSPTLNASREAELQDTVKKVGKLVDQLTLMVGDLREVTQQKEFKETIINLNAAMKHLEVLLRPTGKTVKNLDSAMESLKNTMESAESVMNKVKEGEGSLGKFINDPALYDDLRGAIQSINLLLGKAGALRTYVDLSAWNVPAYDGTKARFSVMIAPNPGRYYLIGLTVDPRGRDRKTTTTTILNNGPANVEVKNVNEEKGLRVTALFGKFFGPLELRAGIIEDSGAVGAGIWFDENRRYGVHADLYYPGRRDPLAMRAYARAQVWSSVYFVAGMDTHRKVLVDGTANKYSVPYFFGAGLFFDDDDLKYLLAFR